MVFRDVNRLFTCGPAPCTTIGTSPTFVCVCVYCVCVVCVCGCVVGVVCVYVCVCGVGVVWGDGVWLVEEEASSGPVTLYCLYAAPVHWDTLASVYHRW